ncbi:MAG TPA: L-lactate dehydrogenase [Polyangiales bacterium]
MQIPACIGDYRELARQRLPGFLFGYLDGGSFGEVTLRDNEQAWARRRLRQFVLRDVSELDVCATLLGQELTLPVVLAPVGLAGLMRRRGEVQAVRAADAAGVAFCMSTVGLCSLEEVRAASTKPFWFQLYLLRDRGIVKELLARARAVQCSALVFTVDLARVGVRYSDIRHGMATRPTFSSQLTRAWDVLTHPRWLMDVPVGGGPLVFGNLTQYVPKARNPEQFKSWVDSQFDPSANWKDIEWLRTQWDGPIVLKGILEPEDARQAASIGMQGIVVSNHGGRQLDGAEATADALPRIVDAVAGKLSVLVDGGVRYGNDLIKARALGADAVMIGRPWAWALAARGEAGVRDILRILDNETRNSLGLMGLRSLTQLTRSSLLVADASAP